MTQLLGPKQEALCQALESGHYKQCGGVLYDGDGYCCLGVASVLEGKKFVFREDAGGYVTEDWVANQTVRGTNQGRLILTDDVCQAYKFHFNNGFTKTRTPIGESRNLPVMNDGRVPFPEIAAVLRANPEEYFSEPA